jgi:hypothetical protein
MEGVRGILGYNFLDNDYNNHIYFDASGRIVKCDLTFICEEDIDHKIVDNVNIYIALRDNDTYFVEITEEILNDKFIAHGDVKFINGDIYVNDIKDGPLMDKYEHDFIIMPNCYLHIFDLKK